MFYSSERLYQDVVQFRTEPTSTKSNYKSVQYNCTVCHAVIQESNVVFNTTIWQANPCNSRLTSSVTHSDFFALLSIRSVHGVGNRRCRLNEHCYPYILLCNEQATSNQIPRRFSQNKSVIDVVSIIQFALY